MIVQLSQHQDVHNKEKCCDDGDFKVVFILLHSLLDDHEQGEVNLWKDGGNNTELSCSGNKFWLIFSRSIVTSEVLNDHDILADDKDEEGWGYHRTGETEEHQHTEIDDSPNIAIRQRCLITIAVGNFTLELR